MSIGHPYNDLKKENERLKKENESLKEDLDFKDRNYKSDYVSEEDRERVARQKILIFIGFIIFMGYMIMTGNWS